MTDAMTLTRLQEAAQLAHSGRRLEAAPLCRRVLAAEPDNLTALLWLGYCSPSQLESEEAIDKAYQLQPQHPAVLKAVDWYNNHFIDQPAAPPVMPGTPETEEEQAKQNIMHTPVGPAVADSQNFFMSQVGGMIIGSTFFLVVNLFVFLNYTFLRGISWTPFGMPRLFWALVALGIALIAAAFLVFSVRDALTPPVKAHGYISNRKIIKRQVKSETGMTTDFYYELDFLADPVDGQATHIVRLTLTKDQYEASDKTNRAYVVYSQRLGVVKLYQPLRSVYK